MYYTIIVFDIDGCELATTEERSFMDAKRVGHERITDKEYLAAGAYKVEVRDDHNVCIWDKFAPMLTTINATDPCCNAEDKQWSGSCAPEAPADWWVDDDTGEYVRAATGERMSRDAALLIIGTWEDEPDDFAPTK